MTPIRAGGLILAVVAAFLFSTARVDSLFGSALASHADRSMARDRLVASGACAVASVICFVASRKKRSG